MPSIPPVLSLFSLPMWDLTMPPLALACLGSFLRQQGISVELHDLNIELYRSATAEQQKLWELDRLGDWIDAQERFPRKILPFLEAAVERSVARLRQTASPYLGFSVTRSNALFTKEVLERFAPHKGGRSIILGGHQCAHHTYRKVFDDLPIDWFVEGEGELALLSILQGKSPKGVVKAPHMLDLEKLDPIDFEGLDLSAYTSRRLPVFFGRGCVCRCSFCEDFMINGSYRYRNPDLVFKELSSLAERYEARSFLFVDLLLNGRQDPIQALCRKLAALPYQLSWHGLFVIDRRNDLAFFQDLKKAGCHTAVFGMEHVAPSMLKRMKKRFRAEDVPVVLGRAREAGLITSVNVIVGYPGETAEDFDQLLQFFEHSEALVSTIGNVNTFTLIEHTPIADHLEEFGIHTLSDWRPVSAFWWDESSIYEERAERLQKLMTLLKAKGYSWFNSNAEAILTDFSAHPSHHLVSSDKIEIAAANFFSGNLNKWDERFDRLVIDNGQRPSEAYYKVVPRQPGRYRLSVRYASAEPRLCQVLWQDQILGKFGGKCSGGWDRTALCEEDIADIEIGAQGAVFGLRCAGMIPHLDCFLLTALESSSAQGNSRPI